MAIDGARIKLSRFDELIVLIQSLPQELFNHNQHLRQECVLVSKFPSNPRLMVCTSTVYPAFLYIENVSRVKQQKKILERGHPSWIGSTSRITSSLNSAYRINFQRRFR